MAEEYVTKSISIPRSVADRVVEAAEQERRKFSNMVTVLCEAALEQRTAPDDVAMGRTSMPGELDG